MRSTSIKDNSPHDIENNARARVEKYMAANCQISSTENDFEKTYQEIIRKTRPNIDEAKNVIKPLIWNFLHGFVKNEV